MTTPSVGTSANPDGGSLRCPLGKNCRLRPVNAEKRFAECLDVECGKCPKALSFGGLFFCFLPREGPAQPPARERRE